jgi:hypothetical protein
MRNSEPSDAPAAGRWKVGVLGYQNLINLYLRDCVDHEKKIDIRWAS